MTEAKEKKTKIVKTRLTESLKQALQTKAQTEQMSVGGVISLLLMTWLQKKDVFFDEVVGKRDAKEIETRVYFTKSEVDVLRAYALSNGWSLPKEIRYRVISTFAKKPKLSGEELKAIYAVRSSINVLGVNLNRLIRHSEGLSDDNMDICRGLVVLMGELKDKINHLEKCSSSRFKLKDGG